MATISPKKEAGDSDFDPSQLLAARDEHEKSITNLTDRISKIEGWLCTPQALAGFFREAARDSRELESVFADMICKFMKDNAGVAEAIKGKIEETDRNYIKKQFTRFGKLVQAGIILLIGIFGRELGQWIFSFFPHAK